MMMNNNDGNIQNEVYWSKGFTGCCKLIGTSII
jgi:hypothetical protein